MEEQQVVIVGAGIAGLATAVALHRVGIPSLVLERSEELRTTGAALTLFPNAWLALDALGVSHKLNSLYPPCSGGSVTDVSTGAVQDVSFSRGNGNGPRPLHRKALLQALANELPTDSIRFGSHLTSIEQGDDSTTAVVHLKDGTSIKSKILIGCDGLHSVVAQWLGLSPPVHSGRSAVRGLAFYPEGHGFGDSIRQFVDSGKRAGFVPLNDKELYWFLTCQGGQFTYDPKEIQADVLANYAADFPQVYLDVVRHSDLSSLTWAPLMLRYPWNIAAGGRLSKGNVTVAGDAMHPMTPDLGQGGGSALEDAVVLGRHIAESPLVSKALDGYVKERKWRAAGLVAGAFMAGWVQQGGSNWWRRLVRFVYYKYLMRAVVKFVQYDCGKLPLPGNP
ncbi:Monooxygenase 2 [Linum grandiflorum]